jgi:hypothetical protein
MFLHEEMIGCVYDLLRAALVARRQMTLPNSAMTVTTYELLFFVTKSTMMRQSALGSLLTTAILPWLTILST